MERLYGFAGAALGLLPEALQTQLVMNLVERPQRTPPLDPTFTRDATPARYGSDARHTAWYLGDGPLVLCLHGWGGAGAADLGKLARELAGQGFRVACLDMTGHGASPGKAIGFGRFIADIAAFCSTLQTPVHAAIGFSAGGLSMMAARAAGKITTSRYICISSPCEPYPPVRVAAKKLRLSPGVEQRVREHIAAEFRVPWEQITGRCFSPRQSEQLLLVYDEQDSFIDHRDTEAITAVWRDATVVKTSGNKHRLMPQSDEVIATVCRFLA